MATPLTVAISQEGLNRWAELSGDLNPLHNDPAYVVGTRYGGTIIHGHLTLSWLMQWAQAEWGPAWITTGRLQGLRFRRPLRPGVEYQVVGTPISSGWFDLALLLPDGDPAVTATAGLRT